MDPIQIAIIAAVALLLVVALTVVVTRSRGRAELPPAEASPYPGDLGAESSTATATSSGRRRPPPPPSSGPRPPPAGGRGCGPAWPAPARSATRS